MTTPNEAVATAQQQTADIRFVPFKSLAVAPENMRFGEPADAAIPQLANTVEAAGIIVPLIVRPGRKKEADFMILEGRRRYLAIAHLIAEGRATEDLIVKIEVETDLARQQAALFLTNTQRVGIHVADAIAAIGKMRKAKFSTQQIADALGYDEIEIKRLAKLAGVHPLVVEVLRAGKINLGHARSFARLQSQERQAEIAQSVLDGDHWWNTTLQNAVSGDKVDAADERLVLIGLDRYAEAGGRLETDLFGELPAVLLDGDKLDGLWRERVAGIVQALKDAGLEVFVSPNGVPEGFERPPYTYRYYLSDERKQALAPLDKAYEAAKSAFEAEGFHPASADADPLFVAAILAKLDVKRAEYPGREFAAVTLSPERGIGFSAEYWTRPYVAPAVDSASSTSSTSSRYEVSKPDVDTPRFEVDTGDNSHSLHETYTDYATRGLIRALADDPTTALTFLVAQLFSQNALHGGSSYSGDNSASTIRSERYSRNGVGPVPGLDADVRGRLDAHRETFLASGLRPLMWVDSLAHGEKMVLLAELVAMTLNVREARNTSIRRSARVQAAELAELTSYDITAYWTPTAEFLKGHSKKQLLALLAQMDVDAAEAASLKKDELVSFVAERAAEKVWAPDALGWAMPNLNVTDAGDRHADDDVGEGSCSAAFAGDGVDDAANDDVTTYALPAAERADLRPLEAA
ncbi:ParB N-terminal domain-containing protein [Caulobacter sp. 17J65-9]|uniref:ParB/RepB/Spo0J family partition protein n=1 Tax=Caulobacter sp. 17J65-9 TaxID=2709382 RepID=UPI0013CA318B|nr:ParB N-terminal domain-containing protein [Caulobacter sp. 17J65-9]NEX91163.1 ParB N-terminal domain-containing protein [Caulobacter sp. 17J65-9]